MLKWLAKQKFRYDVGSGFMSVLTFAAALIGASDKIAGRLNVSQWLVVVITLPLAVISIWLFGYLLDRGKFYNLYTDELNERNKIIKKLE